MSKRGKLLFSEEGRKEGGGGLWGPQSGTARLLDGDFICLVKSRAEDAWLFTAVEFVFFLGGGGISRR